MRKWTNQEIAKQYSEYAKDVAGALSKLTDIQERCEYLSTQTNDNGNPAYDAEVAIGYLGRLLSSLVIYADEYSTAEEAKEK